LTPGRLIHQKRDLHNQGRRTHDPLSFHRSGHNLLGALPSKQRVPSQGIQETLGAMASGGEPPPYRPPTGLAGVYVRTAADSVAVGDTVMFNYELVPPKGRAVRSSAKVNWESSDTSVATV